MHLVAHTAAFLAGCGLAAAWDYDVCQNDCSLTGVAMPDQNTFQLPLESFYSEQCPPIIIGEDPNAPLSTSTVCLTFSGPALHFNFAPFPGYNIVSAVVTWKVMGNIGAASSTWSSPPPTTNILCTPTAGGPYTCALQFSDILGVPPTTSTTDLMHGMCPNDDQAGLGFYFQFSGLVEPVGGGPAIPFVQEYPCATRAADRTCTAYQTQYSYIEVAYRCTLCDVTPCPVTSSTSTVSSTSTASSTSTTSSASSSTSSTSTTSTTSSTSSTTSSAPPTLKTCDFGTAFGYENPSGGVPRSTTLNTQSGAGCNRWGWYLTPTVAELQGGISGPLYVGAGGNDITKAVDVGIWVATANAQGRVTVTYLLNPPYMITQAHVDLVCLPLTKCAPGQYTYNAGSIPNLPTWSNPTPLVYPTCTGGSMAALIVHAEVSLLTVTSVCPAPEAA